MRIVNWFVGFSGGFIFGVGLVKLFDILLGVFL